MRGCVFLAGPNQASSSLPNARIHGVALAWQMDCVVYVPAVKETWPLLAAALEHAHPVKVRLTLCLSLRLGHAVVLLR